jgi:hypothetical protein
MECGNETLETVVCPGVLRIDVMPHVLVLARLASKRVWQKEETRQ